VFDELAPRLFSVASRLTRSRADAEDLTQATWLAAIEHARRFDPERPLQPWLFGILVRQAQLARRRERTPGNAPILDELAAPAHDDPVETRDTREFVERAIARLSPHDRLVLQPWLLDERGADELARELAARPDTVRMRVHRGLARLRRLLATGLGLAAFTAWLDRRALARTKEIVMQATCPPSVVVAPSIAAPLAIAKLVTALVAVTVLAVAVFDVARRVTHTRDSAPVVSESLNRGPASERIAADVRPPSSSAPTSERTAVPVGSTTGSLSSEPTQWRIIGRVSGASNGNPTAEIVAFTEPTGTSLPLTVSTTSSSDGDYTLDVSALVAHDPNAKEFGVKVDHATSLLAWSAAKLAEGKLVTEDGVTRLEMRCDFALSPAAVVRGRVALADPDPSKDYEVYLHPAAASGVARNYADSQYVHVGTEFVLRSRTGGKFAVCALTRWSAPMTLFADASLGHATDVGTIDLPAGSTIRGSVDVHAVDPTQWVVGARRKGEFGWGASANPLVWKDGAFRRLAAFSAIGVQGTFAFTGLEAVDYELALLPKPSPSMPGFDPSAGSNAMVVAAPADGVLIGSTTSVLELAFVAGAPAPAVAAVVLRELDAGSAHGASLASGATLMLTLTPGADYSLVCSAEGWDDFATTLHAPPVGRSVAQPIRMSLRGRAQFDWRVVDESGAAIHDVAFGFVAAHGGSPMPAEMQLAFDSPELQRALHSDQGVFEIRDVPIGNYTVRVHAGTTYHDPHDLRQPAEFALAAVASDARTIVLAKGGRLHVDVATHDPDAACASFSLVDAQGAAVAVAAKRLLEGGASTTSTGLCAGANDIVPNLAPGDYALTIRREGFADKTLAVAITIDQVTSIELDADAP
jgi:RNA polymerase sigma-70 factor (ECF subfamily)